MSSAAPALPRRRSAVPAHTVIAIAAFGGLVAFLGITLPIVAVPELAEAYPDPGFAGAVWVVAAYALGFGALLLASGPLAEILGRRRGVRWGLGVFAVGSAICLLAPSYPVLIAGRVGQGAGAALLLPAAFGVVLAVSGPDRRADVLTGQAAVVALAAALGPLLGGALVALGGWRTGFAFLLAAALAARALASRVFVESRGGGARMAPDLAGALLLAVGLCMVGVAITTGATGGWDRPGPPICAGLGVAFALVLVRRSRARPASLLAGIARGGRFGVALAAASALAGAASLAALLTGVVFLGSVWGYGALAIGLALAPGPLAAAAVSFPAGRALAQRDPRALLALGGLVWASGLAWLREVPGSEPAFLAEWLPGVLLAGAGAGLALSVLARAGTAGPRATEKAGTAAAVSDFATSAGAREIGVAAGLTAVVALLASASPADGWTVALVAAVATAACALAVGRGPQASATLGDDEPAERAALDTSVLADARGATAFLPTALFARDHEPSVEEFLAAVPAFEDLDRARLHEIAVGVQEVYVRGGEVLYEAGDTAHCLYVVRSGRLEELDADGEVLREYATGDVVGELALLAETERTATGRARRDSMLLEVARDHFDRLIDDAPGFARALARSLSRQLQATRPAERPPQPRPARIAVCSLTPGLDPDGFAAALTAELERTRKTAEVRDDGQALAEQTLRLERLELDHRRLVLTAGDASSTDARRATMEFSVEDFASLTSGTRRFPGDWSGFCLRQADRVLALVDAPPPPGYEPPASLHGCDLLVCGELAQGALAGWWAALQPRSSQRVLPGGRDEAVGALARRLTGRSIGVALSGGGARGFAHIGVLEELEAAGVVIDRVAGCSMGAWVGGLYAQGLSPEEIDAVSYDEWVRRNPLDDYTLPRHAIIRGEKCRSMFLRCFPGDVEHLPRACFTVACDLVSGDLVVNRHGRLAHAVATSMILPGLAPPVATPAGELLVDGGLRNNLPVDVLVADNEGPVIAVDVGGGRALSVGAQLDYWTGDRTPPELVRQLPSIGEILARVVTLGSADASAIARTQAVLYIHPEEEGVGMLDFHQLDRMRAAGRRAARAALGIG